MKIDLPVINEVIQNGGVKRGGLITSMANTKTPQRYDVSTVYVGDLIHEFVAYDEGTQVINRAVTEHLNNLLRMAVTNTTKSNFNEQMLQRFLMEHCNVN